MVLPSALVLPGLGAAGRPAALAAIVMFAWWSALRTSGPSSVGPPVALRWALLIYALAFLAATAAGLDRGVPGVELRAMDRALLLLVGYAGVILTLTDGLRSVREVERVVWWTTALGALGALVGVMQFAIDFDVSQYMRLPGLRWNTEVGGFATRGFDDFSRVRGFARHPIEFGVVLATLLPAALHAVTEMDDYGRRRRWLVAGLLAFAIPLSVSRSAIVAVVVVSITFALGWSWQQRLRALGLGLVAIVVFQVVTPGLLGTIRSSFTNFGNDDSVSGRTEDYEAVGTYVSERPWFGRGPDTFIPSRYRVLDNQYLMTLIDSGFVGLTALAVLMLTAIGSAVRVASAGPDPRTKSLARALSAGLIAMLFTFATFDALSFPLYTGLIMVWIGCVGALSRLTADEPVTDGSDSPSAVPV